MASAAQPLRPGDPAVLGAYTLLGRLGQGGMGVVYLARGPDGRKVAVKVIHAQHVADPQFRQRFGREVEAARRVPRFCTAAVLDADLDAEQPYLVTEYVDGPSLQVAVARDGPLRGSDLDALAVGVVAALTSIHDAGLIHRDLKPGNVLLSRAGPRVIDFGIARAVDASAYTATGQVLGTPGYMAPEQVRSEPVTPAADVFAWGGVVAFAASGEPPFGRDLAGALHRVLNEEPDLEALDDGLRRIVEEALRKDPGRRPAAGDLLDELVRQTGRADTARMRTTTVLQQAAQPPPPADTPAAPARPGATPPGTSRTPPAQPAPAASATAVSWPATGPEAGAGGGMRRRPRILLASVLGVLLAAAVGTAIVLDPLGLRATRAQDDSGADRPDRTATGATTAPGDTSPPATTAPPPTTSPPATETTRETSSGAVPDRGGPTGGMPPSVEGLLQPMQILNAITVVARSGTDCEQREWEVPGGLATLACSGGGFDRVHYTLFDDFETMDGGFTVSALDFDVDAPANQSPYEDCADDLPASGFWSRGRYACYHDSSLGAARVVYTVDDWLLVVDAYSVDATIAAADLAGQDLVASIP